MKNTNFRILLILAFVSATPLAQADDITIDPTPFQGGKTRAEVRAELDAYRRAGVNPWSRSYNPLAGFRSSVTRAEVTADYIRNRDAVAAMTGEDSGSSSLARLPERSSPDTRLAGKAGVAR